MDEERFNNILKNLDAVALELHAAAANLSEAAQNAANADDSESVAPPASTIAAKKSDEDEESVKPKEIQDVNLVGISDDVAEKILKGFQKTEKKEEKKDSGWGVLAGILGAAAIAALAAAFEGPGVFSDIIKILLKAPKAIFDSVMGIGRKISKWLGPLFDGVKNIAKMIPGGSSLIKMFTGIAEMAGKFFSKGLRALKIIPIFGDILNLYFAYERWQQGDYIGSILELAGAIPGFGIVFDLISLARDLNTTEEERVNQNSISFFKPVGEWVMNKIKSSWFYKGVSDIVDGAKEVMSGNIISGLKLLGTGAAKTMFAPLLTIVDAIEWVASWFSNEETQDLQEQEISEELPRESLVSSISSFLSEKVNAAVDFVKEKINKYKEIGKDLWNKATSWATSWFGGDDEVAPSESPALPSEQIVESANNATESPALPSEKISESANSATQQTNPKNVDVIKSSVVPASQIASSRGAMDNEGTVNDAAPVNTNAEAIKDANSKIDSINNLSELLNSISNKHIDIFKSQLNAAIRTNDILEKINDHIINMPNTAATNTSRSSESSNTNLSPKITLLYNQLKNAV